MKKIVDLSVTVTYTVNYKDIEVPEDVYEQMMENSEFSSDDMENQEAFDWLVHNIEQEDALNWSYEVDDIEDVEEEVEEL